jgi:hypothetical protein
VDNQSGNTSLVSYYLGDSGSFERSDAAESGVIRRMFLTLTCLRDNGSGDRIWSTTPHRRPDSSSTQEGKWVSVFFLCCVSIEGFELGISSCTNACF